MICVVAVLPSMSVQEHAGNDKSCVWHATDFADGELKDELFCIRFASVESEYISNQTVFFSLMCLLNFVEMIARIGVLVGFSLT